ncbi:tripartite tricarboxylate transporter substrate binding protein [Pelagibacterium nitratireducens]|uniref:Tripartite tricarboxylate transporter substrate binding protein n=1 Tax=Pelagibacterium nitratireducens TaxID=1046114 RepID=A0ABZ2I7Z5_9HYPH
MKAATVLALLAATPAAAQSWTADRPVEVVVGVSPGGSMDFTARLVRDLLVQEDLIPEASIVNNKPGGGHAVALAYTSQHEGNPNYIQIVNTPLIANSILGRSPITYEEFTPIAMLFEENMVFAVRADSDIADGEDLVQRMRDAPDSVSFSVSSGLGTVNHAAVMQMAGEAGVDLTKLKTVAFNSSSEGVTATLGGHVDVVVTTARSLLPFRESGDLRFLAVAAPERLPDAMSDVPTWRELGVDAVVAAWRGVVAPSGLTEEQAAFWSNAVRQVTESESWKETLAEEFMVDIYRDGQETAQFFADETESYSAMIEALGVTH